MQAQEECYYLGIVYGLVSVQGKRCGCDKRLECTPYSVRPAPTRAYCRHTGLLEVYVHQRVKQDVRREYGVCTEVCRKSPVARVF